MSGTAEIKPDKLHTCCFTGHRPEKMPFENTQYSFDNHVFRQNLEYAVQNAILNGYLHFITGMSRGMDLWAALKVLDFKRAYPGITLEAAIPCPEQADRWSPDDIRQYKFVLTRCDIRTVISPQYTSNCMYRRNIYMVDNASLLIAAYDGRPGGTRHTCDYAKGCGVKIYNLLSEEMDYTGTLY